MKIKTIRLKEFKRFDDLTIDLGNDPKKIVALVGPNGCGKSSVFDAFEEKLKDFRSFGNSKPPGFYSKAMFYADLALRKTEYSKNDSIQIVNSNNNSTFIEKNFYVRTSYRFTSKIDVKQIAAKTEVIEEQRPSSSMALDSRLQSNYERMVGTAYSEFEKGQKTGEQVKKELTDKINAVLSQVLDIQISSLGNVIENKGSLYFKKENTVDFPYANLSAGEKEVVDLIIDVVVKSPVYNDTIYCIDEPELHLNTAIQRKLISEIDALIPDNCQLWIATHSVGFLRALQEELKDKVQILDFGEQNYFQGVKTIIPLSATRENWRRIFATALDDLTHLLAPERIVYCEGTPAPVGGAEVGLDAIVYNDVFGEEFSDTLFISAGGGDVTRNAVLALQIISKAFTGVSLLRVKDRDTKTLAERMAFLAESHSNRMLLRREIENYLFDKEVLNLYASSKGVAFDEGRYNSVVHDIQNQDLKLVQQQIQHSVSHHGTIADFKKDLRSFILKGGLIYNELQSCIF